MQIENKKFTMIPLYPFINPLIQVFILTSKIKVKITDDNLANINAINVSNTKCIFLFFNNPIIKENTIPSKIKKYRVGGIGIFVR